MRGRFLLLAVLVLTLLGPRADAAEERAWRGLDVPYLSDGKLHFRGNATRVLYDGAGGETSLATVSATRDGAILQFSDELYELPARRGHLRLLTRHLVGVPLADPVGDWVFWTEPRGDQRVRLVGYDTRRDLHRRGPLLGRDVRVWAVDGDTAYVSGTGGATSSWRPGTRRPVPVPTAATGSGLLTDVDDGRYVVSGSEDDLDFVQVRTVDGTVLGQVTEDFGETFDPTGRYLATWGGFWDSETAAVVPVDLGRWTPVSRSWAPSGELVVVAHRGRSEWSDRSPARRFACDPATGACERLPDPRGLRRYTIGHEAWTSSALLQLGFLVGS